MKSRDPKLDGYVRLFMMPGVLHCEAGAGPDKADWITALDSWVDQGKAPDRIIASKFVKGSTVRTRPLCPHPQRAVYKGRGSTDEAENFVCRQP